MPYRSSDKTRQKKDAKRTGMMQAAVQVFAEKGYHNATVRDIVSLADVAVGTFYFYFPDKETLFTHLYDETAEFLIQTLQQASISRRQWPPQVQAIIQAYVNLAIFEPAIIQLLLVGGGGIPALAIRRQHFREQLIQVWQRPLAQAISQEQLPDQDSRYTAEAIVGAVDEVILHLLNQADPELAAAEAVQHLTRFIVQATAGHRRPAAHRQRNPD
jgi:TetR/AcrR family transcriptional regulator, fatty acid metabolism regulator protein